MAIFSTLAGLATTFGPQLAGAIDGGDDGTVPGDCPGQASIRDGLRRAFANAPPEAMDQFRRDIRRVCTNPDWPCYHGWNDPVVMARGATGGHDCTHSPNSRQFVPIVDDFIAQWGSESAPATSWQTNQEPPPQLSMSGAVADFGGPGGAPLGIPVWAWLLIGVAAVALVMKATGNLNL